MLLGSFTAHKLPPLQLENEMSDSSQVLAYTACSVKLFRNTMYLQELQNINVNLIGNLVFLYGRASASDIVCTHCNWRA